MENRIRILLLSAVILASGCSYMPWRKDAYLNAAGDRIVCAAHGALFEVDSGLCVQGPCLGDHLRPMPFTLTEAGELLLTTPPSPIPHDMTPGDPT